MPKVTRQRTTESSGVYWQPNDRYLPEHHIEFGGDLFSATYENRADLVDETVKSAYNREHLTVSTQKIFDIDVYRPSNMTREISAGDKGVLIATMGEHTYTATAICQNVSMQIWDSYTPIVNYSFVVTELQIGQMKFYVIRVDMGDGTYVELLMTEAEKEQYGTKGFTERYLNKLAVNRW